MSWVEHHSVSERFASDAEVARLTGQHDKAQHLYKKAAAAEELALEYLAPEKQRTLGITAVSATALHYKAAQFGRAEQVAGRWLSHEQVPGFAKLQLRELLQNIWFELACPAATPPAAQILVSVHGRNGQTPLRPATNAVLAIESLVYRTMERLAGCEFRSKGPRRHGISGRCRTGPVPANPSSLRFRVSVAAANGYDAPEATEAVDGLMYVMDFLAACHVAALSEVVPDASYRNEYIKQTRELALDGKKLTLVELDAAGRHVQLDSAVHAELADWQNH